MLCIKPQTQYLSLYHPRNDITSIKIFISLFKYYRHQSMNNATLRFHSVPFDSLVTCVSWMNKCWTTKDCKKNKTSNCRQLKHSGLPDTLFQQGRTKQTVAIYNSEEDTTTQQEQASTHICVNNIVRLL